MRKIWLTYDPEMGTPEDWMVFMEFLTRDPSDERPPTMSDSTPRLVEQIRECREATHPLTVKEKMDAVTPAMVALNEKHETQMVKDWPEQIGEVFQQIIENVFKGGHIPKILGLGSPPADGPIQVDAVDYS